MGTTQMFYRLERIKELNEEELLNLALINQAMLDGGEDCDNWDSIIDLREQFNYKKFGKSEKPEECDRLFLEEIGFNQKNDILTNMIKDICNFDNEFIYNYISMEKLKEVYHKLEENYEEMKNKIINKEYLNINNYKYTEKAIELLNEIINYDYNNYGINVDPEKYYIYFIVL